MPTLRPESDTEPEFGEAAKILPARLPFELTPQRPAAGQPIIHVGRRGSNTTLRHRRCAPLIRRQSIEMVAEIGRPQNADVLLVNRAELPAKVRLRSQVEVQPYTEAARVIDPLAEGDASVNKTIR